MKLYIIEIDDGDPDDPVVLQVRAESPKAAYDRIDSMSDAAVEVTIAATIDLDQVQAMGEAAFNEVTGGKIH